MSTEMDFGVTIGKQHHEVLIHPLTPAAEGWMATNCRPEHVANRAWVINGEKLWLLSYGLGLDGLTIGFVVPS